MILGLNHITIAVSDLARSLEFYIDVLGFKGHVKWQHGAYLSVGDLWFCLSVDTPSTRTDYSHIAFDIAKADFDNFKARIAEHNIPLWKNNKSEGDSLYFLDPDGHQLEVHVGSLETRLQALKLRPYDNLEWL